MYRTKFWLVEEFFWKQGFVETTDEWCIFVNRKDARDYLKCVRKEYPNKTFRLFKFIRSYEST